MGNDFDKGHQLWEEHRKLEMLVLEHEEQRKADASSIAAQKDRIREAFLGQVRRTPLPHTKPPRFLHLCTKLSPFHYTPLTSASAAPHPRTRARRRLAGIQAVGGRAGARQGCRSRRQRSKGMGGRARDPRKEDQLGSCNRSVAGVDGLHRAGDGEEGRRRPHRVPV
eukprot:3938777-Rhodomonas_salina.1